MSDVATGARHVHQATGTAQATVAMPRTTKTVAKPKRSSWAPRGGPEEKSGHHRTQQRSQLLPASFDLGADECFPGGDADHADGATEQAAGDHELP